MENPKENNKVENHHTVNAVLSLAFVFSATKLVNEFEDAEVEIDKNKGEVIRERELQVIEQQEELQARLVNLNIGPQEPVSNYPTSNYYANSYPANEVDPLESYIPPEPSEM
ncbi:hypothetical protein JHK84_031836 [Glycine max]|nr:hypothetical protein JHK87_031537 [Glycine soja]KAG4989281.1 hypothetical protein JHK85_032264 [Glycine max]KAG4994870.1 hypothetical protein JHK86_031697 [Glycine max]KAG5146293.1 hypothetical protein JHK84_031836 [Glycine max]